MVACLSCGESNLPTQRFCGACGHPLERDASPRISEQASLGYTPRHLAEKILGARSALEGERKPVTVLFCDIVGSTPLADRLGADRMHAVLNAVFASALEAVHRFEGTVNQFLGDGLMALFGAPLTHEDHPRRAVLAALAIRDGVLKHSAQWLGEPGGLNVRIGLNTGAVIVGKIGDNLRMDYTAVGDTTNVAARLQGAADPGTILIGEEVYRHVTRYVHSTPLGLRKLKGKADPIPLYRVESELHSGSKPRTPVLGHLIGRDQEVAELDQCFERLAAQRQGCVLVLTGDAGLGKTRLITEARRMAQSKEIRWLEAGCLSFGRTFSYLPFREILTKIFALNDTEGDADKVLKIRAQLDRLFSADAEQFVPFIARMLSLPLVDSALSPIAAQEGAVIGSQVFRSVTNLLERLSENSPTILTFEDWHWADQSSSELLIHLMGLAGRVPIVFLVAMRREAQGPAFELTAALQAPEASGVPWRQIALVPLPETKGNELLKQLLGGGSLSMHLKEQLLQRACGNPFYMIELVHTLIATGAIDRNAEGWVPTARFDSNVLPETI
jgi:class 3 adenylate cyclase